MSCTIGIKRQLYISAILYLGQMIVGYTISWTGPIIPKLQNAQETPLKFLLSDTQISLVGSVVYIGSIPAPFVVGWYSNYKGRKPTFIFGGVTSFISFIILSTTRNLEMLFVGRVLNCFASSMIGVTNVMYIGEVASISLRGSLLIALGMFTAFGSILVFSVAPYFPYYVSTYIGMGLSILFTATILTIPESPFYYVLKEKEDKAIKHLVKLGRIKEKEKLLETKKEYTSTSDRMDWIELFTLRTNRRALSVAIIINILQQCSGGLAVIIFSGSIFEMAGSSINSNTAMITIGSIQLIGSVLSPILIKKLGTKKILLLSIAVCCINMFFMGLYFYLQYRKISMIINVQWLPLVILTLFFIGYECGFGILPLTLIGEMFTINVRGKGSAIALSSSWLFGFGLTSAFAYIIKTLGAHVLFWFFSISCACAFVFTKYYIPETKGKSLIEIQQSMGLKTNGNISI